MACERYEDALTETAAGAAPASELEAHLASCAACRQELDVLRQTLVLVDSDLHQLVAVEPSPELAVRIRQATAEASPAERHAWLWPALAAAAALALAFLVVTRRAPSQPPVVTAEGRVPEAAPTQTPEPEPPHVPPSGAAALSAVPGRTAPRDHALAARPRRPVVAAEPEVLVPPGQVEALLRLAALVNRQHVASPSLAAVDQGSPDLAVPQPIDVRSVEITPLEIVPLDAAEQSGTLQGETP